MATNLDKKTINQWNSAKTNIVNAFEAIGIDPKFGVQIAGFESGYHPTVLSPLKRETLSMTIPLTLFMTGVVLLSTPAFSQSTTTFPDLSKEILREVVLEDQYGEVYDKSIDCWVVEGTNSKGDAVNYCLDPLADYLMTRHNDTDIYTIIMDNRYPWYEDGEELRVTSKDQFSRNQIELFWLEKDPETQRWHYIAQMKDFSADYQRYEYLSGAHFRNIGPNKYGWEVISSDWGTNGYGSRYNILYPSEGKFKVLFQFPERLKEAEDYLHTIVFLPAFKNEYFYPIRVMKKVSYSSALNEGDPAIGSSGDIIENYRLYFDEASFQYQRRDEE